MTYISNTLRNQVYERANGRCEYCLLPMDDGFIPYEIDHIYAEKHGGETTETNLCLSCFECNHYKGSDICFLDPLTGDIAPLFHPRHGQWVLHFTLDEAIIRPLTPQGRIAVRLLHLNDEERISERRELIKDGRYP